MKKQAFNPYLKSYEYVPDGEPYVFDGRIYVYGSHDRFNGESFCLNDYVCWSADVADLSDWRYEGVIYKKDQDPGNKDGSNPLFAPDMQKGLDGKYYLYYCVNGLNLTSVAVCDTPAGSFEFLGYLHWPDGTNFGHRTGDPQQFDPGSFIDDDGRIFHYTGFSPWDELRNRWFKPEDKLEGSYCIELERDMMTVKTDPVIIVPGFGRTQGTGFEGHAFFEASSLRKFNGRYYFIYSSENSHELCYAISDRPDSGFAYGGTLISNGDIFYKGRTPADALNYTGNTHGSLVEIKGDYYVFYHRQTNRHQFSRQACAEKVFIKEDGHIEQAEMTSCGLNRTPLLGLGRYPAYIACNLMGADGARFSAPESKLETHPYFTQDGEDREDGEDQYIANMQDGAVAGFKYFDLNGSANISLKLRGSADGVFDVHFKLEDAPVCSIPVRTEKEYQWFTKSIPKGGKKCALYFKFKGFGYADFAEFRIS